MHNLLFVFVIIFTIVLVDVKSATVILFVYLLGLFLLYISKNINDKYIQKIYNILYISGSVYLVSCYVFMRENGFQWLLAYDLYNYFQPTVEKFIQDGNYNYFSILTEIFKDFNFFGYDKHLYFVYSCLWGLIAYTNNIDLYFMLQLSVLFIFPFIGILIYKILQLNNFNNRFAANYTIIICTCSILFFYSSQFLRDIHILFLSLLSIYYTFKIQYSSIDLLKLFLVIICIASLRIESGIFMFILIPIYVYIHFNNKGNIWYNFFVIIIILTVLFVSVKFFSQDVETIMQANQGNYIDDVSTGNGVIGTLQKIPIVGDILSIIYNALQPLPCWSRLIPNNADKYGYEAYNVMGIVRIPATFFNYIVIVYIIVFLLSKKIRGKILLFINKPLKVQLFIGFIFLYIQSAVISQRRLMPYYCIFYILFYIIYTNISSIQRKKINNIAILIFVVLQVIIMLLFYK